VVIKCKFCELAKNGIALLASAPQRSKISTQAQYAGCGARALNNRLGRGDRMNIVDLIGWTSSAVLLLTIGRQVYTRWRTKSDAGVSRWLFIGQLSASTGFALYSYLLHNWVFLVSNIALLVTGTAGEIIYLKNKSAKASH
jgi:MtN3 and saliva related transmembrane protein